MDTPWHEFHRLLALMADENAAIRAELRNDRAQREQEQAQREQERAQREQERLEWQQSFEQSFESAMVEMKGQLQSLNVRVASSVTPSSSQLTSLSCQTGDTLQTSSSSRTYGSQQTSSSHPSFDHSLSPEDGCHESAALWHQSSEQPIWAAQPQRLATPPQDPVSGGSPAAAGMALPVLPIALNAPLSFMVVAPSASACSQAQPFLAAQPPGLAIPPQAPVSGGSPVDAGMALPSYPAALNPPLTFTFVAPSASECSQADSVVRRVAVSMPTQNPRQCPLCLDVFVHKRLAKPTATFCLALQHSHVRSHCRTHMKNAMKPSSHCRFMPGFPPHDILLINIRGSSLRDRWDKFVKVHTLTRRAKKKNLSSE